MKIRVDYGYDSHSLEITDADWSSIQSGEPLTITGPGFFVEGELDQDFWAFNEGGKGSLNVACDSGRQIYGGSISDLILN